MPISEEKKLGMFTQLAGFSLPIYKDRTVFILMVLITVFDLESDDSVTRLRNGFFTILRRYLLARTHQRVYKIFTEMGP